jgi:hypothetical protein
MPPLCMNFAAMTKNSTATNAEEFRPLIDISAASNNGRPSRASMPIDTTPSAAKIGTPMASSAMSNKTAATLSMRPIDEQRQRQAHRDQQHA